ncbi:MAG: DUF5320 domain-containing protein [Bacteroidota bacterium]
MPGFNRTGPQGAGPMTGRQHGPCNDNNRDVQPRGTGFRRRPGWGAERRGGRGFKFRWGNPFAGGPGYYEDATAGEASLENEVRVLKDQLSEAEKELEQLRKEKNE